jgi:hypothetical protein
LGISTYFRHGFDSRHSLNKVLVRLVDYEPIEVVIEERGPKSFISVDLKIGVSV